MSCALSRPRELFAPFTPERRGSMNVDPRLLQAIVFDVDGTLYRQGGLRRAMVFRLLREMGLRPGLGCRHVPRAPGVPARAGAAAGDGSRRRPGSGAAAAGERAVGAIGGGG